MFTEKVILLGLDGASFNVIDPLIEKGALPNFKRLKAEGVWGELRSNIHPITPSAWASISTGLNPGRHGVFDFRRLRRSDYNLDFVNGTSRQGKPIWQILSGHGKKVGIVNVPLTYPSEEVNGFMISGMDTPGGNVPFTYPSEFESEIKTCLGNYTIDIDGEAGCLEEYLAVTEEMFCQRVRLFEYLMETKTDLDFLYFVFVETDRLQHVLWKYMDPGSQAYVLPEAEHYRKMIADLYGRIDELIGRYYFDSPLGKKLMLVSDHGFGLLEKDVYLNKWLEEIGLLKFKDQSFEGGMVFLDNIDWSATRAYAYGFFGNINLNLKGREGQGIVASGREEKKVRKMILKAASQLIHPETKEKIVSRVYLKEDLYHGPYAADAPDILLVLKDYAYITRDGYESYATGIFHEPMKYHQNVVRHTGMHRIEGVFMMHGDQIPARCLYHLRLTDILPTVLTLFGINANLSYDGKSILNSSGCIDPVFLERFPGKQGFFKFLWQKIKPKRRDFNNYIPKKTVQPNSNEKELLHV